MRRSAEDSAAFVDMLGRNRRALYLARILRDSLLAPELRDGEQRYASLALPGFNPRRDVAFVYGQFTCGRGCDWTEGFVLELRSGTWLVVARRRYSVS